MARITRVASTSNYRSLQTARLLVLIFTVIFILTGLLFAATGTYAQIRMTYLADLVQKTNLSSGLAVTPLLLISVGGVIILTSVLGFFSAVKDNLCLINCFCLLLTLVCVTEVIGGILACAFLGKFQTAIEEGMQMELANFTVNSTMNQVQSDLGCCGVTSYTDYNVTAFGVEEKVDCTSSLDVPLLDYNLPASCCLSPDECVTCNMTSSSLYYQQGCAEKMFEGNKDNSYLHYLVVTSFSLMVVQLIGIFATLCLFRRLRTTLHGY